MVARPAPTYPLEGGGSVRLAELSSSPCATRHSGCEWWASVHHRYTYSMILAQGQDHYRKGQ